MSPVTAEDEFLIALTTVRATYGTGSIGENDLKDIVATEESRVADAAVLAELISSRLAAAQPSAATVESSSTTHTTDQTAPSLHTPIPFPSSGSTPQLSIADLIDGMLTQEKRDVRTSPKY